MKRRTKARIAIVVSALSLISMLALALVALSTALFQPLAFGILILFLLFLWLAAIIAAISYSKDGWTVRGSGPEWILAAMIDPIMTAIMHLLSKGEQDRGSSYDSVDLVEYKRRRMK